MRTLKYVLILCTCCLGLATLCYSQAPMARKDDTTAHGATIVSGSANVLIGGKPAARANIDTTWCPLVTPTWPPAPHGTGTILTGSSTVLINGYPAAHVGSVVMDGGGADEITYGCPTVFCGL